MNWLVDDEVRNKKHICNLHVHTNDEKRILVPFLKRRKIENLYKFQTWTPRHVCLKLSIIDIAMNYSS